MNVVRRRSRRICRKTCQLHVSQHSRQRPADCRRPLVSAIQRRSRPLTAAMKQLLGPVFLGRKLSIGYGLLCTLWPEICSSSSSSFCHSSGRETYRRTGRGVGMDVGDMVESNSYLATPLILSFNAVLFCPCFYVKGCEIRQIDRRIRFIMARFKSSPVRYT